ncbi:hypothetical protein BP5796_07706 [Coleophoma crateriformis]|uniref:RING-type domain-containing protein n=1 Tax=Coleophoma crateriformis TaxID=565419 RepID=A0A3D8RCA0_9HELO|nr:hypothetical protein BP5796_07706 [Coleophoma crateriformis]
MDANITDNALSSTLQNALILYSNFLQYMQQKRESSLPRHGKEVETTIDVSTEQGLQSQVEASKICLQLQARIVDSVRKWMVSDVIGGGDSAEREECEIPELDADVRKVPHDFAEYMEMAKEQTFIDPFSGKLIEPTTPFSAGPSQSQESGTPASLVILGNGESEDLLAQDDLQGGLKVPLQDLKAFPLTITMLAVKDVLSEPSSRAQSIVQTPQSATPSSHSEDPQDLTPEDSTESPASAAELVPDTFASDVTAALELQAAWDIEDAELRRQFQYALTLQDGSTSSASLAASQPEASRREAEHLPDKLNREALETAFNGPQDDDGLEFVQSLQEEEERRAQEIERAALEAKRLAAEWEREDAELREQAELAKMTLKAEEERTARINAVIRAAQEASSSWAEEEKAGFVQQEEFAREVSQAEEERAQRIQNDILAAQREQSQWENEIREQEEEERRAAEERMKAAAAEAQRVAARIAEEEQRARIEQEKRERAEAEAAERRRQEEIATRNRQIQEETQRQELARRAKEENERRARQADCLACRDPGERSEMAILPCNHAYCGECIAAAFKTASGSRTEFQCCKRIVPVTMASRWLEPTFITSYEALLLERSTPNPRYCSNRSCNKFIPPQHIHGPICIAAFRDNIELVQLLLAAGADANDHAVEAGADVSIAAGNACGITALQGAAIGGYVGIALKLLEAGADSNAPGSAICRRTALEGAAEHGRTDMVKLLFNTGAYRGGLESIEYKKALRLATREGYEVICNLIRDRFEKSAQDDDSGQH